MTGSEPVQLGWSTWAGSRANRRSIEIAEAVRALVAATADRPAVPASEVLVVLRHLETAGFGLAQGLQQLTDCLGRSTEAGLYWAAGEDVDPSEVPDTVMSVAAAVDSLSAAAGHAVGWAVLVATAQRQIVREAAAVELRLQARRVAAGLTVSESVEEPSRGCPDPGWVTVEEAAELTGVAPATMRNRHWRRHVAGLAASPDEQHGLLFRRAEVLAVGEEQRRRTGPVASPRPAAATPGKSAAEWLTVAEAAQVAGVAVSTMQSLRWRRDFAGLAGFKDERRRLRFRRADVVAVRARRRRGTAA